MFVISKAAGLNQLVQGGQLYRSFPFSENSLIRQTKKDQRSSLFCDDEERKGFDSVRVPADGASHGEELRVGQGRIL
jgi:hypothetical protein